VSVRLLEKLGCSVVVAANGQEAVALLEQQSFDAVLMDVQMPAMDGLEATALIRQRERATGRHVPIIALTAHALKEDRQRCLEAGMDGYVSKPIDREQLWQALTDLLPVPSAAEPGGAAADTEVLDRRGALARVDGDVNFLREMAGMFLEDCPKLMAEIRGALAAGDAPKLQRAAHRLKGEVGQFQAAAAFAAARQLEELGRAGQLREAAEAQAALEAQLHRLQPALAELTAEPVA
jgi:CheY-like chemotaxis protein/HPt (histidine-containing phosphotransfer) domain-containing protein